MLLVVIYAYSLELGRLRQDDFEFKDSVGYVSNPVSKARATAVTIKCSYVHFLHNVLQRYGHMGSSCSDYFECVGDMGWYIHLLSWHNKILEAG